MRWTRYCLPNPSTGTREWTRSRVAAAARAVRRDAESVPLFPELRKYQSVGDRMAEVDSSEVALRCRMRSSRADAWRRARRQRSELPAGTRQGLDRYWEIYGGPADPSYLLEMLREIHRGESPWSWLRERRQLVLRGAKGKVGV